MKKEKLSAEERRKLVTDFFRKITEVTDAADEMSNILKNGGPAPDSTKLSKVFESMRDSHITSSTLKSKKKKRVKEDVKASKEYLLAHLLIINGISPNGFMSSKGKIKKVYNPLKKDQRKMSICWEGKKYINPNSAKFRGRYASFLISWLVQDYESLYRMMKGSNVRKKYSSFIEFLISQIVCILNDESIRLRNARTLLVLGSAWNYIDKDMTKRERRDLISKIEDRVESAEASLNHGHKSSKKELESLFKFVGVVVGNHKIKIKGDIKKDGTHKNKCEAIVRAIGDAVLQLEKKKGLSPVYIAWRMSHPYMKSTIYNWWKDKRIREGLYVLNFIKWMYKDQIKYGMMGIIDTLTK